MNELSTVEHCLGQPLISGSAAGRISAISVTRRARFA